MRVGVNALTLVPNRIGGLEHYLRRLLDALVRGWSGSLVVFTPPVTADTFHPLPGRLDLRPLDAEASDTALARAIGEAEVDLWWCPWVDWRPYRPGVPLVVTVPDLQHEHLPDLFAEWELPRRRTAYFAAAHLAAAVMTFSSHARRDLCDIYGLPPERVHAVPLAEGLDWEAAEPRPERVEALRGMLGDGFLYYPAAAWPHKDHATLLAAVRSLLDRGRAVRLVLTGLPVAGPGPVVSTVRRLALQDNVSVLEVVGPEDVRALYRLSAAVVVPSRFEGFGLPVLEAMRSGTPVICADAASLPEVGADAVLYFRAGDPDALVAQVERLLDGPALRAELVRRGLERAASFSWRHTARRVAEVFETARASGAPRTPVARALEGLAGHLSESTRGLEAVRAESAERLDALRRLDGESRERLEALYRLDAESRERLEVINRLAAALRRLDERLARARPRAWLGLCLPWEALRARRALDRARRELLALLSS